jgi:5-methylcytosine-specific restriction enzyme subunit McrC
MSRRKLIRRFEHSRLLIGQEGFEQRHWQALAAYNDKREGLFFDLLGHGIKFKSYVGVIQVSDITIEILPKVDRSNLNEGEWQVILLDMLRECHWMRVHAREKASLRLRHNFILDAYLEIFLNICERLLHEGLVKKYRKEEGNVFALKGKLKFARHIRHNLVHEERFYTEHSRYDLNNIYNQILLKALKIIPRFTVSATIRDQLSRLLLDFPELPDMTVNVKTFQKLSYNRKTERYKEAMEIAAMLLLNYRPDIRGGNNNVLAILFDMNELWEEFVFRRLSHELDTAWRIQRQSRKVFWEMKGRGMRKILKPDIVIFSPQEEITVIDTKWKIPDNDLPSDEDLRQIFAYNSYWYAALGILLYPEAENGNSISWTEGEYKHRQSMCAISKMNLLQRDNSSRVYLDKTNCIKAFLTVLKRRLEQKSSTNIYPKIPH